MAFRNRILFSATLLLTICSWWIKSKPCKSGPTFPPMTWESKAFVLVPGKCPTNRAPSNCPKPSKRNDECIGDADCKSLYPDKQLKCCEHKCDFRCVPMPQFQMNSGNCSLLMINKTNCKPKLNDECRGDVDCNRLNPGQVLKCCKDGCDYKCMKTLHAVPGECPIFTLPAECPPEPDDECKTDFACAGLHPGLGLKCCKDGCDFKCVKPNNATTSRTITTTTTIVISGKCPVFPLPDECPPEPDNECKTDFACAGLHPGLGFKCCKDGCDFKCVPPIKPKNATTSRTTFFTVTASTPFLLPGKCPAFSYTGPCPRKPDHECLDDKECVKLFPAFGFKCCKHGCRFMCTLPIYDNND